MRNDIWRYENGALTAATDETAPEEPLAITVDGRTINITMRTPGHDLELAAGFLHSENIRDFTVEQEKPNAVDALLRGPALDLDKLTRHVFASSSCGLCGKTSIDRVRLPFDPIKGDVQVEATTLLALPDRLRAEQATFSRTGGLHAAGAFTLDGECLLAREDIGRHNAVDKVLGWGLLNAHLPFSRHVLLVSGRTSFEILQKSVAGGFPIVAAVSAPSSLAVQFARESGQTLVGFLREGRMNVYAHPERIV